MDPVEAVAQLGGSARWDQLARHCTTRATAQAVACGALRRLGRGRYALPSAPAAHQAAARLHGSIAGPSAALEHGFALLRQPDRPWVAVPANRRVDARQRRGVRVLWTEPSGTVTSPLRTALDCARHLPWVEALAVADSALRSGLVDADELITAAACIRGPGSRVVHRVAEAADPRAQSALESALRAIALEVPGLRVEPQVEVESGGRMIHPDLLDRRLRIVIEAEGWLFHGGPEQFRRDLRRYTDLVVDGWLVLRFGWADVIDDPDRVRECLTSVVRRAGRGAGAS